ncbi:MATH domain and coiled-coil domain-containing protein [Cardamine amara subsp. amara]|uniref:MATH domain and coiled-coil domain-containing protein n=1 Tax=Cardamine amara subsp. amara TaxID=228776 RepID=A0ABD1AB39_CARAN
MSSNISSTTLQSWRQRPPSSYSIKVQNLFQFESSTLHSDGKYKSRRFSSGDYKWRMIIYPKGNDKDNGSGFISMYVEIDSTSLTSKTPIEVYTDLRFFVFNKKENKYFTIQDVESKPFNTLRTMWGLSQVLPLDTFEDRKNGYLFDGDYCEFGVDIIVAPPPTKWEILSFDVDLPYTKFSWTVKNFSVIQENPLISDTFTKGGKEWVLKMYPKSYSTPTGKWFSIFLAIADGEILEDDEEIYVKAQLKVEDPYGSNHLKKELNYWFPIGPIGSGFPQYVSMAELRKSYLDKEDTLNVEIEFDVVSAIKYSSFT